MHQNCIKDLLKPRLLCLPAEFLVQEVWIGPKNLHFQFFLMILKLFYLVCGLYKLVIVDSQSMWQLQSRATPSMQRCSAHHALSILLSTGVKLTTLALSYKLSFLPDI